MHVDIKPENLDHALKTARELDCSVTDYVNALIAATREAEYVREFTIQVVSRENPQKKQTKTIIMRRRSSAIKYTP